MQDNVLTAYRLLRAHGRCTGAMIFSIFGGGWLLLAAVYSHRFSAAVVVGLAAVSAALAVTARRIGRGEPEAQVDGALALEKQANDRRFGVVNAVTWGLVFLVFAVLPRMGWSNYVFPAFVGLVGLHFFPMPRLYRHVANWVTGGALVVWAVVCAVWYRGDGPRMAAMVTLGAGVVLWASAGWGMLTARRMFREARAV